MVGWHHRLYGHAAAAAKSLQSCPTLCDPIDGSPPGSAIPGILQARTLEWVAISFSNAWKWNVKVKLLCRVQLFTTPWTAAYQAPLSMGFSRQEYWSGLPLPSPQWTWVWVNSRSWWWTGRPACCGSWGCKELDRTERLNWNELILRKVSLIPRMRSLFISYLGKAQFLLPLAIVFVLEYLSSGEKLHLFSLRLICLLPHPQLLFLWVQAPQIPWTSAVLNSDFCLLSLDGLSLVTLDSSFSRALRLPVPFWESSPRQKVLYQLTVLLKKHVLP